MHFDWRASRFLTKQFQVGLVGYVYDEIYVSFHRLRTLTNRREARRGHRSHSPSGPHLTAAHYLF
jgi:hypothetical protein